MSLADLYSTPALDADVSDLESLTESTTFSSNKSTEIAESERLGLCHCKAVFEIRPCSAEVSTQYRKDQVSAMRPKADIHQRCL